MPTLTFTTLIAAPLGKVWMFHMDPATNLPRVAEGRLEVESAPSRLSEGAEVVARVPVPGGGAQRVRTRVTELVPPHGVLFGQEARFTDEQVEGPMAVWRHMHELESAEGGTLLRDIVTYQLHGGLLGAIKDALYVRWQMKAAFRGRGRRIKELLDEG